MRFHWRLVLLLLPSMWAQTPATPPATQVIREFYNDYQRLHFSGLPDRTAAQKLSSYWSPVLNAAVARAQQEQGRCLKAHPADKAPWIEGDLFSSNFEGFTTVRVEDSKTGKASRERVTLQFEYATGKWSDQILAVKQGTRWLIDDVIYSRQTGFGNGYGSSLRSSLEGKGC